MTNAGSLNRYEALKRAMPNDPVSFRNMTFTRTDVSLPLGGRGGEAVPALIYSNPVTSPRKQKDLRLMSKALENKEIIMDRTKKQKDLSHITFDLKGKRELVYAEGEWDGILEQVEALNRGLA